jgi:spore maturation protein CgeB
MAINYRSGLAEFCHQERCPLICWEIDPSLYALSPLTCPPEGVRIFTYRRANVARFLDAGFREVKYLPLAANPEKRTPRTLTAEDRQRYAAPLSFVGASLVSEALSFKERFAERYAEWRGGGAENKAEGLELLEEVLAVQRRDFSRYGLQALLEARCAPFIAFARERPPFQDPIMLAAEIAASEKRLTYVANLGKLGLAVWGDPGWNLVERHGVRYMGRHAHHNEELTKVYCATGINIDIGRLYQPDIVTMRVFDVMACGGFLLAEWSDALVELFEPGKEVETYRSLEELLQKAGHYLAHPEAARKIADRGMEAVRRKHDIPSRVAHMVGTLRRDR